MQFLETTVNSAGSMITLVLPMLIVIVFFYLILYLPQKRQEKKDAEMRNSIDVGDEVTTIGGVVGRVASIKDDTFVLETTSDRVKIRFRRSAISSVEKLDINVKKDSKDVKDDSAKKEAAKKDAAPLKK
ncbi:MAG TPA: preprotein translocase subunit YajC [Candidatus Gemmiger avicola]|uniref:Preprotein translocase subunit YajC n=1 Tax=Candidatus Gemmiger avicola TaxID=2838605 RepID=A0A9D2M7F6_9FIRM|nr:preprotein translocase subunit YajC [Candidatus Gemmiger avicola]